MVNPCPAVDVYRLLKKIIRTKYRQLKLNRVAVLCFVHFLVSQVIAIQVAAVRPLTQPQPCHSQAEVLIVLKQQTVDKLCIHVKPGRLIRPRIKQVYPTIFTFTLIRDLQIVNDHRSPCQMNPSIVLRV